MASVFSRCFWKSLIGLVISIMARIPLHAACIFIRRKARFPFHTKFLSSEICAQQYFSRLRLLFKTGSLLASPSAKHIYNLVKVRCNNRYSFVFLSCSVVSLTGSEERDGSCWEN